MVYQNHWLHLDKHKSPKPLDQGVAEEEFPRVYVVVFEDFVEWDRDLVVV
jgi:hypothetical protein